jgi:curved DNA-binding protein CbpA
MSILAPFEEALVVLGVGAADDAAAVKKAYRRAVVQHPPDTDPDGFRRVRDAYELLCDPWKHAEDLLLRPLPEVPTPASPAAPPPAPRGATAVALLRLAALQADPDGWAAPKPSRARQSPPGTPPKPPRRRPKTTP